MIVSLNLFFVFFKYLLNISVSSEQISKTGHLDSNLICRQNKSNVMTQFMELKSICPTLKQSEIAKTN